MQDRRNSCCFLLAAGSFFNRFTFSPLNRSSRGPSESENAETLRLVALLGNSTGRRFNFGLHSHSSLEVRDGSRKGGNDR